MVQQFQNYVCDYAKFYLQLIKELTLTKWEKKTLDLSNKIVIAYTGLYETFTNWHIKN